MNKFSAADYIFDDIFSVSWRFLRERGISLLLLDLDNTLAPYGKTMPSEQVIKWSAEMAENGIQLFIVSNNKTDRVEKFAKKMGAGFIMRAKKPKADGVIRAMAEAGKKPEETALAGDQTFADVLAANRAGITSLLVMPVSLKNPLFALRFFAEFPMRKMCKNDLRKKRKQ